MIISKIDQILLGNSCKLIEIIVCSLYYGFIRLGYFQVDNYLAHIWGAKATTMRKYLEIMIRGDPKLSLLVNMTRVCDDLREVAHETMVFQNGLNEVEVGIT